MVAVAVAVDVDVAVAAAPDQATHANQTHGQARWECTRATACLRTRPSRRLSVQTLEGRRVELLDADNTSSMGWQEQQ